MNSVNRFDLSIIILSYRSKEHLKVLLPSIWGSKRVVFVGAATGRPQSEGRLVVAPTSEQQANSQPHGAQYTGEVIIVDNGSPDGTYEWLENYKLTADSYKLIRNINNGFAAGNNIGIKQSTGRYVLLLNPDTKVEPDTFKVMLDFMETHPDVGMSTCKIMKPDGSLDRAARRKFPNPWNAMLRFLHLQKVAGDAAYNFSDETADQESEIDSLVGAFCLARKDVVEKIGLLDETFFMYGEDLDWCWRCKEAGFKVWYYPQTFITHYKGESSRKVATKALRWFHDAMWIFYRKHYREKYPFWFNWLVYCGIYARMWTLIVINSVKSDPRVSR